MTYEELVTTIKEAAAKADASKIQDHIAFQFNVEGEAAGAFYLEITGGEIKVEPYEYYDRDVAFTAKAEVFKKIIAGEMDPVFAFTTGKLKVDGSIETALKLKDVLACIKK